MPVATEKTTAALVRAKGNGFSSSFTGSSGSYSQKHSSTPHPSNNNRKLDHKKLKLSEVLKKNRTGKSSSSNSDSSEAEKLYELDTPIQKKYRVIKRLGKGAYGIVWEAEDIKTRERVALKKIFDAFRNNTDAQRTYREIIFLQEFGNHPNIISLRNVYRAKNDLDIYLVFPLMVSDLHRVIKNAPKLLDDNRNRQIVYQILKALKYLHSADVVHRDLKPANILLDDYLNVKVGDFGLARSILSNKQAVDKNGPQMTDYVATRWYRPPEILLACSNYSTGVDMWSIGCILGEMIHKEALFPGNNTFEQMEYIMKAIDRPSQEEINDMTSDATQGTVENAMDSPVPRRPLATIFQHAGYDCVNLMGKLLAFHPDKRPTVEQVLAHPYINRVRCISEELTASSAIEPPLSDNHQLTIEKYRKVIYEMIHSQRTRLTAPLQRPVTVTVTKHGGSSTSANSNGSQKTSIPERYKEPTLTAAAVLESCLKKQREKAASMLDLPTETGDAKPIRTESAISKFPSTANRSKYKSPRSLYSEPKEMMSKSLANLSMNPTTAESNGHQVKVHRSHTLTKMPSSSVNPNKPQEPFPWEENKTVKKPLTVNSNARNMPSKPNYEKKPLLEPLSSSDFAKRRAVLRTAPRVLDKPKLTRNDDFRSPHYYRKGSSEDSSSSLENAEAEQTGRGYGQSNRQAGLDERDYDEDAEYRRTRDKKELLSEAKARSRATTSVPWLSAQLDIQKGQGDYGNRQRRQEPSQSKSQLFATPHGDREIWSRSYTPGQPVGHNEEQGHRSQKSGSYQHQNSQKYYWPSQTRPKQVPGIELMTDENPRIRQSTYFPSRSPSAGGDYHAFRIPPPKLDYTTSSSYTSSTSLNNRTTQFPFLNPKASTSNILNYRSPYEAKFRRPETRVRGQGMNVNGSKNSEMPMRPWDYK